MKRLRLLLAFSLSLPVLGEQIEIEGKWHEFSEIIAQTKFERQGIKGIVYSNPFNGKTVKLIIIPGKKRTDVAKEAEKYWFAPFPVLQVQYEPENNIPPFYELKLFLVPISSTPQGTISFKLCVIDSLKPGLPHDISEAFIEAMEKNRDSREYHDRPAAIELTGELYLSGVMQSKEYATGRTSQIEYTFLPTSVEVLNPEP
jgi:hypothetical protein